MLSTVQLQLLEEIKIGLCNASRQMLDPVDSYTMAEYTQRHYEAVLGALGKEL